MKNVIKATSMKQADALIKANGYYKLYLKSPKGKYYLVFRNAEEFIRYWNGLK